MSLTSAAASRRSREETLVGSIACHVEPPVLASSVRLAATLLITVMTAAAAQVSIPLPFTPVPFTLQPMVVLLGGAVLGGRLGMASQFLYLAAGVAGLPVFAASGVLPPGAARLAGPTAGYLWSYPLAAYVVGYLAERGFGRQYISAILGMTAGLAVIFTMGVAWLALMLPAPDPSGSAFTFGRALQLGFYPFILTDLLKLLIAAAVLPGFWRALGRRS